MLLGENVYRTVEREYKIELTYTYGETCTLVSRSRQVATLALGDTELATLQEL